jgi:hypothetical protein
LRPVREEGYALRAPLSGASLLSHHAARGAWRGVAAPFKENVIGRVIGSRALIGRVRDKAISRRIMG